MERLNPACQAATYLIYYGMAVYMIMTLNHSPRKGWKCVLAWASAYLTGQCLATLVGWLLGGKKAALGITHESICMFSSLVTLLAYWYLFPELPRKLRWYYNFMIRNVLVIMVLISRTVGAMFPQVTSQLTLALFVGLCLIYLPYYNRRLRRNIPKTIKSLNNHVGALTGFSVVCYFGVFFIVDVWGRWWPMDLHNLLSNLSAAIIPSCGYIFLFLSVKRQAEVEQAEKEIYTDALTGLGSRKRLHLDMFDIMDKESSQQETCYLIYIDLDRFKTVNDTYGHDVGDQYLQRTGRILESWAIRNNGRAYRMSGDEFIIISRNNTETIPQVRQRLDEMFNAGFEDGREPRFLGASFGVAEVGKGKSLQDAIQSADVKMYETKRRHHGEIPVNA